MLQKTDYNEMFNESYKQKTYQYLKNVITHKHVVPTTP